MSLVGGEKLPHTLCSVETVTGRRSRGSVRAARRATAASTGEWECTMSCPDISLRSPHGQPKRPSRPRGNNCAGTPADSIAATRWVLSGRTNATE